MDLPFFELVSQLECEEDLGESEESDQEVEVSLEVGGGHADTDDNECELYAWDVPYWGHQ